MIDETESDDGYLIIVMAMDQIIFSEEQQQYFMYEALKEARKAYKRNEVPIGAILVNQQGAIIARAYNLTESRHTQTAHAEMRILEKAGIQLNDWRLDGYYMFVTLEPCAMCYHAMRLSRVDGIIYAASSPLFGYRLDNNSTYRVYKKDPLIVQIKQGELEAKILLQSFFKNKRENRGE